jgi:hypothetical protein
VSYTGNGVNSTVGHGLGTIPKFMFIKPRSIMSGWAAYNYSLASAQYSLFLNLTDGSTSAPAYYNSTAPTANVFSIGVSTTTNPGGASMIAYLWSEVP